MKNLTKKLLIAANIILVIGLIYYSLNSTIEKLFFMYVIVAVSLPVLLFYLKTRVLTDMKDCLKQGKQIQKEDRKQSIENNENPYYVQVKNLFSTGMKNGVLKREDILEFKQLINSCLGEHVKVYNNFNFKNDAHEIYIKLKSSQLNIVDYEVMIEYLLKLQKSNNVNQ